MKIFNSLMRWYYFLLEEKNWFYSRNENGKNKIGVPGVVKSFRLAE